MMIDLKKGNHLKVNFKLFFQYNQIKVDTIFPNVQVDVSWDWMARFSSFKDQFVQTRMHYRSTSPETV